MEVIPLYSYESQNRKNVDRSTDRMLKLLAEHEVWEEFYNNRVAQGHLSRQELRNLRVFIEEKRYMPIVSAMQDGCCRFSVPRLSRISKSGTTKKRLVYQFAPDEMWVLKHLAFLLHRYDDLFAENCFSFRRNRNARHAVLEILQIPGLDRKFCLKADIHNYFNSIPAEKLCTMVEERITDDAMLVSFLQDLLRINAAIDAESGEILHENRGAMAGVPISPFLANLYLVDMDAAFAAQGSTYFRYADDILLFADSREEIERQKKELLYRIREKGLEINEEKFHLSMPGEPITFLGMQYHNGTVDISENTKRKMKAKIRRKARALYRWRRKKHATFEQTAYVMIRVFNRKFYDLQEQGDFSWVKWFFPLINTDRSLKELDSYLIQYIRYLNSGRIYKGNYRISYEQLKTLGFRSLVNMYYKK